MRPFSRTLARSNLHLVAAITLTAAWLVVAVAFAYSETTSRPDLKSIAAAVLVLGIAASAFLYAWRQPGP